MKWVTVGSCTQFQVLRGKGEREVDGQVGENQMSETEHVENHVLEITWFGESQDQMKV